MADSDEYAGHRVHEALAGLEERLSVIDTTGWPERDAAFLVGAGALTDRTHRLLDIQEQDLVPKTLLNSVANGIDQAVSRLDAGSAAGDAASIHEAFASLVAACAVLPIQLTQPIDRVAARLNAATLRARTNAEKAIAAAGDEARAAVTASAAEVQGASDEAKKAAAQARSEIEAAHGATLEQVRTVTEALTKTEENFKARADQLESAATAAVARADTALNGIETRFQSTEAARQSKSDEALKATSEAHATTLAAASASNAKLIEELKATADRAEEVLQLAGATSLAGRWINQARANFLERVVWLVALLAAVIGSLVFGYLNLHELTAPEDSGVVDTLAFYFPRIPLAAITITAIGFMIQQVSRRALWEARDRRVANELTAFPALIDRLEPDKQRQLVSEIATRYLPGTDLSHDQPGVQGEPRGQPGLGHPSGPSSGLYALVGSISTAVVLGVALILSLTK